jgi:hypothetical protein
VSGPCLVYEGQPNPTRLQPPSGGSSVQRPSLSREAEIDARARAFDLAMKIAAQSDRAEGFQFPDLVEISNRIFLYLTSGK